MVATNRYFREIAFGSFFLAIAYEDLRHRFSIISFHSIERTLFPNKALLMMEVAPRNLTGCLIEELQLYVAGIFASNL